MFLSLQKMPHEFLLSFYIVFSFSLLDCFRLPRVSMRRMEEADESYFLWFRSKKEKKKKNFSTV